MSTAAGRFYRGSYLHLRRASKPVLLSVELQVDSQKARPFTLNVRCVRLGTVLLLYYKN